MTCLCAGRGSLARWLENLYSELRDVDLNAGSACKGEVGGGGGGFVKSDETGFFLKGFSPVASQEAKSVISREWLAGSFSTEWRSNCWMFGIQRGLFYLPAQDVS